MTCRRKRKWGIEGEEAERSRIDKTTLCPTTASLVNICCLAQPGLRLRLSHSLRLHLHLHLHIHLLLHLCLRQQLVLIAKVNFRQKGARAMANGRAICSQTDWAHWFPASAPLPRTPLLLETSNKCHSRYAGGVSEKSVTHLPMGLTLFEGNATSP